MGYIGYIGAPYFLASNLEECCRQLCLFCIQNNKKQWKFKCNCTLYVSIINCTWKKEVFHACLLYSFFLLARSNISQHVQITKKNQLQELTVLEFFIFFSVFFIFYNHCICIVNNYLLNKNENIVEFLSTLRGFA